ncbi:MAG: NAD-glutamate dehydrogenase domain-containing protein, partial [Microvirga sp.]
KGTAHHSDPANAISLRYGFWLDDAFASGGSAGYDHKAMGITARGAWESVKRHFREMGVNTQSSDFTVVGVGDMSGDVFGNGMLRSPTIRLIAALDHRDIIIDPDPDMEKTLAERQRLFDLPRSSWQDFDRNVLSKGAMIISRAAKSVTLTPEAVAAIGIDKAVATPFEIMMAILKSPVDLLWFGGIGTYVKAPSETDTDVGDRANDPIRITAVEVRAKVIGEGANLGVTQKGRIAYGLKGGRCNSDAIDNSAGVNTSDVEVNIKIAVATPVREGRLAEDARNALLAEMTDEVGRLVLRNNYLQTLAISLSERRGAGDLGFAQRLMQTLERQGRLDRSVEYLPDDMALTERMARNEALTRPEIAVLLAYAKLALYDALLDSGVPDDPYLGRELERYFPMELRQRFPDAIASHRLRREIIATQLSNAIVNRGGPTIITRLVDQTGADAPTIAAAYAATRDSFGLTDLNMAIDALDGTVPGAAQLRLYGELQDLLMSRLVWFIRNVDLVGALEAVVGTYRTGIAEVEKSLAETLSLAAQQAWGARAEALTAQGVPQELARRLAALPDLVAAPDIVFVAEKTGRPVAEVAATHFAVEAMFRLGSLIGAAREVIVKDYFDRLALDRAIDGIAAAHRRLTAEAVAQGGAGPAGVEAWSAARGAEAERIRAAVETIAASGLTLSKLTVAASLLGDLARA